MKFLSKATLIVLILSTTFLLQCSTTKKSSTKKQEVTIQDVWFSNSDDMDGDTFNSYARLNFDINVSSGSMNVSVEIGVRIYDPADTAVYKVYFTSTAFSIEGNNTDDAKYVSIGYPNLQLPQGAFDFLINVFEGEGASEGGEVLDQVNASTHTVLQNVAFEESITDAGVVIYDAYWEPDSLEDNDNDGYYSEADLIVDVDVNVGDSAEVFLLLYKRASSESEWDLLIPIDQTYTFTVTGTSSTDSRMYGFTNFPHDRYDFRVEAFINDGLFNVEDYQDDTNNNLLDNWPLERADEDVAQTIEIWGAEWTDEVDNDGDNYYSQANLSVDVDVTTGGEADVYLKIYAKTTSASTYDFIHQTPSFRIVDDSYNDAWSVLISGFNRNSYDFMVEVLFDGDNIVQDSMDKNGDSDLGAVNLESAAEDQAASTAWISHHDNSFEDYVYYSGGDFTSSTLFVVSFEHPANAVNISIKKIAINISQDPSFGKLRVLNAGNIYAPDNLVNLNMGWNIFDVDVDVTDHNPFFAGYLQTQVNNPKLSVDLTAPHTGRSWWWNGSEWISETEMDYAIEVFVEYTVAMAKGKTETITGWIPASISSRDDIENVIEYGNR